jgi:hypothetical protein
MRGRNQAAHKCVRKTWPSCYWLVEVVVESAEVVVAALVSIGAGVDVEVEVSSMGVSVGDVYESDAAGTGVDVVGSDDAEMSDAAAVDVASTGNESSAAWSGDSITEFSGVPRIASAAYSAAVIGNSCTFPRASWHTV